MSDPLLTTKLYIPYQNPPLQPFDVRLGVKQRQAHRNLAQIRGAKEAKGRLLGIIKLIAARFGLGDDSFQVFEAAIDEINALAADG